MEAKNLLLKFGLLALAIGVCLYSIFLGNGLSEGIDLRGGHSLIFEIETLEAEIAETEALIVELTDALAAAGEDDRAVIEQKLASAQEDLERLKDTQSEGGNLVSRVIDVVKRRVDPLGMYALEFRPQGKNRFQVRMPIPGDDAKLAGQAFDRALEVLTAGNITRSELRRLRTADADRRQELIASLSHGDEAIATMLQQLLDADQAVQTARAAFDADSSDANRDVLEDALVDYDMQVRSVLATNINPRHIRAILTNHVSPKEKRRLLDQPDGETIIAERKKQYNDDLDGVRARHPSWVAEINEAVKAYEAWDNIRGPLSSPADLQRLIRKAGVLEFRIAPFRPEVGRTDNSITFQEMDRYIQMLKEAGPEDVQRRNMDYVWLPLADKQEKDGRLVNQSYAGQTYLLLHNRVGNVMLRESGRGGWRLRSAFVRPDPNTGGPAVHFELDAAGAGMMRDLTVNHQTHHMAVVLDDEVYSAPVIREGAVISDRGLITVGNDAQEAQELKNTLDAGSLPARVRPDPISISTFGPSMGDTYKRQGFRAAIWSLAAVAIFMMLYYLLNGAVANFALMLNLVLILGAMSMFDAVFTLPGIVGIILTVGIAVDANVLILERLREEQRRGQSPGMTIKNAYDRAFSAIFDANLTTLIVCLILGWIGTEEIRGFAITLGFGVVFSLFTAMVVTRWVYQLMLKAKMIKGHLRMMSFVGVPNINWIGKRYFFWVVSAGLVVLGIVSLTSQGSNVMGVQFSSGTQAIIRLQSDALLTDADGNPQLPNDALIREQFAQQAEALGDDGDLLVSTATVTTIEDADAVANFLELYDADNDGSVTQAEWQAADGNETFFSLLADGADTLTTADLEDRLPSRLYQAETTETRAALIQQVVDSAFGNALERRTPVENYDLSTNEAIPAIGITTAADGLTEVAPSSHSPVRDLLDDYRGGVVLVVTDVSPPMTDVELSARIREMREQPDFEAQRDQRTEVMGLVGSDTGYTSLAVFAVPYDAQSVSSDAAWKSFADGERDLLDEALKREGAMEVRNFDPAIAGEARGRAIMAIILSCAAIVAYLWLRFGSVQWGLAAVLCLVHDVIIVVGLVAASVWLGNTMVGRWLGITSFKIDLPMIAAFLTVIGYSVNDTIVVFDRIRENRGRLQVISPSILNRSINQTLARTLLTSGTTLIVVVIMYVWGGHGIHAFSYALLAGVIFGTYSSIAVASPLLLGFKKALVASVTEADTEEK